MNICLMDTMRLENIMVSNGDFTHHVDGTVSINKQISIKLFDFSRAEIFNVSCLAADHEFDCIKGFDGKMHNAKKFDIFNLGLLLYRLSFGHYPLIQNDNVHPHIAMKGQERYATETMTALLFGMLKYDERERFDIWSVLSSEYFHHYWSKYKASIYKRSVSQKQRLVKQQKRMTHLPYYSK